MEIIVLVGLLKYKNFFKVFLFCSEYVIILLNYKQGKRRKVL